MICCLCGENIEAVDLWMKITCYRFVTNHLTGQVYAAQEVLEDGTVEKIAHKLCMVERGYPLEVIGAGRLPDV